MFAPVPVFVLAGPLGAGKTTVLNHLLRHSADTRIGVIVNDFGDIDVDGLLVSGQATSTVSVSGGCLCCAADDNEVAAYLDRLTRPRGGVDVVVVEASGVAEPAALVVKVVAGLGRRASYGGLLVVVDAEHPDVPGLAPLERQVAAADLVVITKADRVDQATLAAVRERVHRAAPRRPVVEAPHGALDPSLLFDLRHDPTRQLTLGDIHAGEHAHLHTPYRTVSWREVRALHPRRLAHLLGSGVHAAFRVKGFVEISVAGLPRRWTVHRVGQQVRVTPGAPGRRRGSQLVLLGPDLDGAAYDELGALPVEDGEQADVYDLAVLEQFVPRRHRLSPTLLALDEERSLEEGA